MPRMEMLRLFSASCDGCEQKDPLCSAADCYDNALASALSKNPEANLIFRGEVGCDGQRVDKFIVDSKGEITADMVCGADMSKPVIEQPAVDHKPTGCVIGRFTVERIAGI